MKHEIACLICVASNARNTGHKPNTFKHTKSDLENMNERTIHECYLGP